MAESKHYHHWKDGNEYDVVVYLDDEGKGDGYGHGIRTETTMKHWQGNEFVTREDIYGNVVYTNVTSPDGSHIEKYQDASGRWWRESIGADGKGVRETIDEWDGDYPDDSGENADNWRTPEEGETPIGRISQGQGEEPSPYDGIEQDNLAEDHLPPPLIQGEEDHTAGQLPLPDTGIRGVENHTAGRLPGPLLEPAPPAPDPEREAQERARSEEELNPDPPPPPPGDQIPPAEQPVPPTDPNADRQPPEETPGPSFEDLGIEEHHAKGNSNIPDLVEEPAPAPPLPDPGPMLAGDVAGTGVAYPGLVEGGDEGLLPPAAQTPEAEPPVQPTPPGDAGDGGIPGLGVPYRDFIPLAPMVKDPSTGQWRNAEPGEIPGAEEGQTPPPVETEAPGSQAQEVSPLQFGNTGNFQNAPAEPPVAEQQPTPAPAPPDGDGDGIPNEYGDGPDLDGNGIPDEIGINPDSLQPGYPNQSASVEWGGVGVPDPTVVPQSDATTTVGAEAMPEGYGDGSDLGGDWVPEETGGIDPYALQQPAYEDPSASGDGAWDPYGGSSSEPYVPPEEALPVEEAPVAEGEDPNALGSF